MRTWAAAITDAVGIGVFAAVGRASHDESVGPFGVAETAWPFWAGAAVGWLITRAWRRPDTLPTGLGVWASALTGGMLLRLVTGSGVQLAFVIVAGVTLAVILLGWRGLCSLGRRRSVSRAPA